MPDDPLAGLNEAKALAWANAAAAVVLLVSVMEDTDEDMDQRLFAASELLQFALKGPS
jgi:hypothetical protein